MESRELNDDALKVKKQKPAPAPRADRSGGEAGHLLSALGNARVQRLLRSAAVQRKADGGDKVDDEIARRITAKQGTGQALDETARRDLEPALGDDFSDVRVHTDAEADHLNRAVSAEAFTTGRDIFFRAGSYNPGSADGKKLLAHELTHVVQQRGALVNDDFTVSEPEDASEQQASEVASSFQPAAGATAAAISREQMPEEEEEMPQAISREQMPEEEEEMPQAIAREQMPEEEEEIPQVVARETESSAAKLAEQPV